MLKGIKIDEDTHRTIKKFIHRRYMSKGESLTMAGVIKFCVDQHMNQYTKADRDDELEYFKGWQAGVKARLATGLPLDAQFLHELERSLK